MQIKEKSVKARKGGRGPVTLREQAYQRFTQHLLQRTIRPGQFISQRELSELIGLPLGAVRELIPRLEVEGLMKTAPQRGMQVVNADVNLIRQAFQFRLFLEREAVAVFAQQAPEAVLGQLREEHETVIRKRERADRKPASTTELVDKAQAIDWRLHYTIIDSLDNPLIACAYRVNLLKIRIFRNEQTRLHEALVVPTMKEHLIIIEALASRDPVKAAEAMAAHVLKARDRALGYYGEGAGPAEDSSRRIPDRTKW